MDEAERMKEANIDEKFYKKATTLQLFEPIKKKLIKESVIPADTTEQQLSTLVHELLVFQEENLGLNAKGPKPLTKLGIDLFNDYSTEGALCIILKACYEHKVSEGWKKFEFSKSSKKEGNIALLQYIKECLEVSQ